MGKKNNVILHYLSDKKRFADLINAEVYDGRQVISAHKLTEISATTYEAIGKDAQRKSGGRRERRGDLAMRYEDGSIYRIFLGEAQDSILYTLPVRDMEYVTAFYKKQLSELKRDHKRKNDLSEEELLSGINRNDRLKPVYLLWLYHGEKKWDGARSLKDLIDFGDDKDGFSSIFRDVKPHLVCVNEMKDSEKYRTELRELMDMLRYVPNKEKLKELAEGNDRFKDIDEETFEAAAVLLNRSRIWKNRRKYMKEGGRYDMCKGLRDWEAEIVETKDREKKAALEAKDKETKAALKEKDAKILELEEEIRRLKAEKKEA